MGIELNRPRVYERDREAAMWWQKAAEQGQSDAQYWLGKSYESGRGVVQHDKEATKWYRKAAEWRQIVVDLGHADWNWRLAPNGFATAPLKKRSTTSSARGTM